MTNKRYAQGWGKLRQVDGKLGEQLMDSLDAIAPDLSKYIIEFAFGDIYSRGVLDLKQREMSTIAALVALGGCEPQLRLHVNGALNVGLTKEEIIETIMHCIPYTGFPRVLNGIAIAKEVFQADR